MRTIGDVYLDILLAEFSSGTTRKKAREVAEKWAEPIYKRMKEVEADYYSRRTETVVRRGGIKIKPQTAPEDLEFTQGELPDLENWGKGKLE